MIKDSVTANIENTVIPFRFVKDHPQFEPDGVKMRYAIGGSRALYLLSHAEAIQEVRYLDRAGNITLLSNIDSENIGIQRDRTFKKGGYSGYAKDFPFNRVPHDIDVYYFSANTPTDLAKYGDTDTTIERYGKTLVDFSTSSTANPDKNIFGEKLLMVKCKNPEGGELQDFLILHPDHLLFAKLRHCFDHHSEVEKPKFLPELELISEWYIKSFSKEYLKQLVELNAASNAIPYNHQVLSSETTAKYTNSELVIQSLLNSPEYKMGRHMFDFLPVKLQRRFGPLLKAMVANEKCFTDDHISQIKELGENATTKDLYEHIINLTSNIDRKKLKKEIGIKMITLSLAWIGFSGEIPKDYDYIWSSTRGVDLINFIMDMQIPTEIKKALPEAISYALVDNLSMMGNMEDRFIKYSMENNALFQTIFNVLKQKQEEIVSAFRNKDKKEDIATCIRKVIGEDIDRHLLLKTQRKD